jgi:uncharacterized phage-associated protein
MVPSPTQISEEKYSNAILYFLKYCNNDYLGATKLNKLLYYLDFISYRDKSKSVTGDLYIHKDYGPVPDRIDDVIADLKLQSKIEVEEVPYKDNHKTNFVLKTDPDMSVFDSYEQELLAKICTEFSQWSTEKIVSQTHLEAPWFYSKPYDFVDYKYANNIEFFQAA